MVLEFGMGSLATKKVGLHAKFLKPEWAELSLSGVSCSMEGTFTKKICWAGTNSNCVVPYMTMAL